MPFKTKYRLIRRHTATVVNHLNQRPAGILNDYGHLIGTCIHSILHQLFHHGRRSLNDLASGNHIGYIGW